MKLIYNMFTACKQVERFFLFTEHCINCHISLSYRYKNIISCAMLLSCENVCIMLWCTSEACILFGTEEK